MSKERCDHCASCEYKRRAWDAESKLEIRYGLRREIAAELHASDATGDEALRQGLETVKRLHERAARWKAAAKAIRSKQQAAEAFAEACGTSAYINGAGAR